MKQRDVCKFVITRPVADSERNNDPAFFRELWEKKPLLIKRHNSKYNEEWFSSKDFSDILKNVSSEISPLYC